MNPLETLYYAFPAFAYVNPTLVGLLLDPLIQYQAFRLPLRAYAAPNLGRGPVACRRVVVEFNLC